MGVRIISSKNKTTAYLDGEIDHHTSAPIREELDSEIMFRKPQVLCIDFDCVTFMDSSAIGLVMGRYRTLTAVGGKLIVSGLSPQFYKIMKLSGIEKIAKVNRRENKHDTEK